MFGKKSVTFVGTAHDDEGTLTATLECHGFVITKSDNYSTGKINLSPRELVALVAKLKTEFPNTNWED